MVNLNISNEAGKQITQYMLQGNDRIDNLTLGMLVNNDIQGIVSIKPVQIGSDRFFKYDIDGMVTLGEYLGEYVKKEKLLKAFYDIAVTIKLSMEYMINWTSFALDENHIYVSEDSKETKLICVPLLTVINDGNTCNFFKNILFTAQFDSDESEDYVGRLIMSLNPKTYTIEKFIYELEDMLEIEHKKFDVYEEDDEEDDIESEIQAVTAETDDEETSDKTLEERVQETEVQSVQETEVQNVQDKEEDDKAGGKETGEAAAKPEEEEEPDFEVIEIDDIEEEEERDIDSIEQEEEPRHISDVSAAENSQQTVDDAADSHVSEYSSYSGVVTDNSYAVVSETDYNKLPFLIRESTKQRYYINKDRFLIGSDEEQADCYISGNDNIDGVHAIIIKQNKEYFVVDNNSKKGTYMNFVELMPDEESYLPHGVHLSLADEEFIFKMHE